MLTFTKCSLWPARAWAGHSVWYSLEFWNWYTMNSRVFRIGLSPQSYRELNLNSWHLFTLTQLQSALSRICEVLLEVEERSGGRDSSVGKGSCYPLRSFPFWKPCTHSWWPKEAWLEYENLEGGKRRHAMWPSSAPQRGENGRQASPRIDSLQMCPLVNALQRNLTI